MSETKCPCCNVRPATGWWAIVDRNQKIERMVPEVLCDVCANDMLPLCRSNEIVEKVREL